MNVSLYIHTIFNQWNARMKIMFSLYKSYHFHVWILVQYGIGLRNLIMHHHHHHLHYRRRSKLQRSFNIGGSYKVSKINWKLFQRSIDGRSWFISSQHTTYRKFILSCYIDNDTFRIHKHFCTEILHQVAISQISVVE